MNKQGLDDERIDQALDALAHAQRRRLLISLLDHNPQNDSPELSYVPGERSDTVERLIEMEHAHLPKLVEYEFIEWDREKNEVAKGPKFDEIRPLLELLTDHEDELPDEWL